MKRSVEQERSLNYSFLTAPLIAAGNLSDAVCCEGPKRDFAAEKNFRLQNALKMYPAGYTLGPHAFDYSKHYVHAAPQYGMQVAQAPIPEPQPFLHQRNVIVKPIQYTYAPVPPAQLPARIYRYHGGQQVPEVVPPMSPATTDRPFAETACKWSWENSVGRERYVSPPPLDSLGSFPEVGLRTVSTLPENTPRDGYFSTSLPKIAEKGREETKPNKYVPQPVGDEGFAESEHEEEESDYCNKKHEMERTTTTAQIDTQEEEREESENGENELNTNDDKIQEKEEQEEEGVSSDASSELMSGEEQPPFTEENHLEEKREDVQTNKEEEKEEKEEEGFNKKEGKKEKEGLQANNKQMEEEPQIPDEASNTNYGKSSSNIKVKFESQQTDESLKHFPMFSMTTASTFSGIDFMATPRLNKLEGEVFQASEGNHNKLDHNKFRDNSVPLPPPPTNWPVGYVPPPDQKYKKLILGNQVYYEGGTFYLTETGAYLLGLRG